MRVLVTGGAGFIGSNLVRMVLDDSSNEFASVTILDALTYSGNLANLEGYLKHPKLKFVQGDIRDSEIVQNLVQQNDAIINFAAESHVDRSINSREEFVSTNVVGTRVLLDAAIEFKTKKYLQISTDEVYGSIETGSAKEDHNLEPNSPYSASKAAGDLLVRSYVQTFGLNASITRSSNNYGPFQHTEKLIPRFITNLIKDRPLPIYGDGSNIRDWIHVDDNCRGILKVFTSGAPGEIYNIGGNNEITNLEITKLLLQGLQKSETYIEYVTDRLGHDFRYSIDSTKVKTQLGFEPSIEFKSGLADVINWYLQNHNWWANEIA
jgi:dTDP-glucose 4,6-dehydratase